MSIKIGAKTDTSFLFNSINNGNAASGLYGMLSDYSSIKSGTYGKLMKAYYSMDSEPAKKSSEISQIAKSSISTAKDDSEVLSGVEKSADSLKDSADKLLKMSKDDEDVSKSYDAVKNFVDSYNSLINSSGKSNSDSITNRTTTLATITNANVNQLAKVGIGIEEDGTLKLNKDMFHQASAKDVSALFEGNRSYGYKVSAQASLIDYAAQKEASKANTYTLNGAYSNNYANGNLFDSMF